MYAHHNVRLPTILLLLCEIQETVAHSLCYMLQAFHSSREQRRHPTCCSLLMWSLEQAMSIQHLSVERKLSHSARRYAFTCMAFPFLSILVSSNSKSEARYESTLHRPLFVFLRSGKSAARYCSHSSRLNFAHNLNPQLRKHFWVLYGLFEPLI